MTMRADVERQRAIWSDRAITIALFIPLVVFGCLAVVEEATWNLIEEWGR